MTEVITIDDVINLIPAKISLYQSICDEIHRASRCYGSPDIVLKILDREIRVSNYNIGRNLYTEYENKFRHLRKHLSYLAYSNRVKEFLESL